MIKVDTMCNIFDSEILNDLFQQIPQASIPGGGEPPPLIFSAFNGQVIMVQYYGVLSLARLHSFKPILFSTLTGGSRQIIVDLKQVTAVSRSTLGTLVDFAAAVLGRNKKMHLFSPPGILLDSLAELQLRSFFDILSDEEELINILPNDEERLHGLLHSSFF
jgi:anti-anti-sigma regulatory factor